MAKNREILDLETEDDDSIELEKIEEEEDILESVEEPKIQENLTSINTDDSVRIYLQQIGKIPLLSSEEELSIAKKIQDDHSEISVASKEQSQGIEQINKAIQQMEQVLQANASTAEESASASHELSSQADSVKDIVNILKMMVEGK